MKTKDLNDLAINIGNTCRLLGCEADELIESILDSELVSIDDARELINIFDNL